MAYVPFGIGAWSGSLMGGRTADWAYSKGGSGARVFPSIIGNNLSLSLSLSLSSPYSPMNSCAMCKYWDFRLCMDLYVHCIYLFCCNGILSLSLSIALSLLCFSGSALLGVYRIYSSHRVLPHICSAWDGDIRYREETHFGRRGIGGYLFVAVLLQLRSHHLRSTPHRRTHPPMVPRLYRPGCPRACCPHGIHRLCLPHPSSNRGRKQ